MDSGVPQFENIQDLEAQYFEQQEAGREVRLSIHELVSEFQNKFSSLGPPSTIHISRVREYIRAVDNASYTPFEVTIGPYHWNRESRLMKHDKKINLVRAWAGNNVESLLQKLAALKDTARGYYTDLTKYSSKEFVRILLHDGCFVVTVAAGGVPPGYPIWENSPAEDPVEVRDVVYLLENQIPFVVLQTIWSHYLTDDTSTQIRDKCAERIRGLMLDEGLYSTPSTKRLQLKEDPHHLLHLVHIYLTPTELLQDPLVSKWVCYSSQSNSETSDPPQADSINPPIPDGAPPNNSSQSNSETSDPDPNPPIPQPPQDCSSQSNSEISDSPQADSNPQIPKPPQDNSSQPNSETSDPPQADSINPPIPDGAPPNNPSQSNSETSDPDSNPPIPQPPQDSSTQSNSETSDAPQADSNTPIPKPPQDNSSQSISETSDPPQADSINPPIPDGVPPNNSSQPNSETSDPPQADSNPSSPDGGPQNNNLETSHSSQVCSDSPMRWHRAMEYYHRGLVQFQGKQLDGRKMCSVFDVCMKDGKLLVPRLRVDGSTWTILRNLMALEQHYRKGTLKMYVTAYCFFISQLACEEEDVNLLVRKGVIDNALGNNAEVAKGFADLCKGAAFDISDKQDNYLWGTCQVLEDHYKNRCWNLLGSIRMTYFGNRALVFGFLAAFVIFLCSLIQAGTGIYQLMTDKPKK